MRGAARGIAGSLALGLAAAFAGGRAGATGDRLFPSTMLIEDTQNDDELALPMASWLRRGANGDRPAGRDLGSAPSSRAS